MVLQLWARGGDDRLFGGAGNDELAGDGVLQGDAVGGNDQFIFAGAFGQDTVRDFRQGEDVIQFRGIAASEVQIQFVGSDTVLTTLADDSVTLRGFTGTLATGVDLIFA